MQLQVLSGEYVFIIDRFTWVLFYLFFGLVKNKRKRNPLGVIFKLFSDYQNMKRSPSNFHFELVKLNELTSSQYTFTPFSGWDWLFTKKVHLGRYGQEVLLNIVFSTFSGLREITKRDMMEFSFSSLFKLSKYEKDTELFLGQTH